MGTPSINDRFSSNYAQHPSSKDPKAGNAHNVTVEECREMLNDPERSRISKDDYDKLSPDEKACYELDKKTGEYRLTQELIDVVDKHSKEGGNNV